VGLCVIASVILEGVISCYHTLGLSSAIGVSVVGGMMMKGRGNRLSPLEVLGVQVSGGRMLVGDGRGTRSMK